MPNSSIRGDSGERAHGASVLGVLLGVAMIAAVVTNATAAAAQTPNIFGIWIAIDRNSSNFGKWNNTPNTPTPEFTVWGAEQSREQGRLGTELPTPGACEPVNPVMFLGSGLFPTQILNGGNQIVLLNEWVAVPRRIYVDGRRHPPAEDLLPTWEGHSIAHWEGDTLVVDTVGFNGRTRPLNGYVANSVNATPESLKVPRLPSSDQMHLLERFRLVATGDILEVTRTITDPKTYVRPFSNTIYLERRPDLDVQEYYCSDNMRNKDEGH
jgi:hypothetical protein